MATKITEDCINCGACEPECPNTAIYQGGVGYESGGAKHPARSEDFFYIVPELCTECVGFFDQEACAVVCPVDCCVPDPQQVESEEVLMVRAKNLHPDTDFGSEFPSRFRTGEVVAATAAATAAQGTGAAQTDGQQAPQTPDRGGAVAVPEKAQPSERSVGEFPIPLRCQSCGGEYEVMFEFCTPGTVLRCPYCQFSFSPGQRLYLELAGRIDSYVDRMNAEIDRHVEADEVEATNHAKNTDSIEASVSGDIRDIVRSLTETPQKSVFG